MHWQCHFKYYPVEGIHWIKEKIYSPIRRDTFIVKWVRHGDYSVVSLNSWIWDQVHNLCGQVQNESVEPLFKKFKEFQDGNKHGALSNYTGHIPKKLALLESCAFLNSFWFHFPQVLWLWFDIPHYSLNRENICWLVDMQCLVPLAIITHLFIVLVNFTSWSQNPWVKSIQSSEKA